MRYFFDGKIEKLDDIYSIHIPFNVWEVCKQRDVIQAEIPGPYRCYKAP